MHGCMVACMHACMYVCLYACRHACMRVRMHVLTILLDGVKNWSEAHMTHPQWVDDLRHPKCILNSILSVPKCIQRSLW